MQNLQPQPEAVARDVQVIVVEFADKVLMTLGQKGVEVKRLDRTKP